MSSSVFYFFSCNDSNKGGDVAGWVLSSIMFGVGIAYFGFFICGGPEARKIGDE
jgi:hypothetical protein